MIAGRAYTMPELVRAVIETRESCGITIAQSFEQVCRQYGLVDGTKNDLNHAVREFLREYKQ